MSFASVSTTTTTGPLSLYLLVCTGTVIIIAALAYVHTYQSESLSVLSAFTNLHTTDAAGAPNASRPLINRTRVLVLGSVFGYDFKALQPFVGSFIRTHAPIKGKNQRSGKSR